MSHKAKLLNHPQRIRFSDIQAGDIIEAWTPRLVPAVGGHYRWQPDPSGEYGQVSPAMVAVHNSADGVGRWTNEFGQLVHSAHGGLESEGVPITSGDHEILLRKGHLDATELMALVERAEMRISELCQVVTVMAGRNAGNVQSVVRQVLAHNPTAPLSEVVREACEGLDEMVVNLERTGWRRT